MILGPDDLSRIREMIKRIVREEIAAAREAEIEALTARLGLPRPGFASRKGSGPK